MSDTTPPQDFAATVAQLETIVERLESGELSLEDALTAFEQGVRLTRDAQQRRPLLVVPHHDREPTVVARGTVDAVRRDAGVAVLLEPRDAPCERPALD